MLVFTIINLHPLKMLMRSKKSIMSRLMHKINSMNIKKNWSTIPSKWVLEVHLIFSICPKVDQSVLRSSHVHPIERNTKNYFYTNKLIIFHYGQILYATPMRVLPQKKLKKNQTVWAVKYFWLHWNTKKP